MTDPSPHVRQCATCPWKVSCDPLRDIPNGYSVELHEQLRGTIAEPGAYRPLDTFRAMACHYSEPGEERACAGWLHHQIGPGNNLSARLAVMRGDLPIPEVDGEQHETFEATLPGCER